MLAFGIGYKEGSKKIEQLEKQVIDEKLKAEQAENAGKILKDNIGKSDADIVRDAIKRRE